MTHRRSLRTLALAVALAFPLAACGGDAPAAESGTAASGNDAAAPAVELTGNVIEVKMASAPGRGEVFDPADFTAQRGDVVRFVLESGVHNASFPANKNPSGVNLPAATPYLQAPGQTYDVVLDMPPGEYFYQCDPHVPMGMVGTITIVD
jgi:plastocyanin